MVAFGYNSRCQNSFQLLVDDPKPVGKKVELDVCGVGI